MAQWEFVEWLLFWILETSHFEFEWDKGNETKNAVKHKISTEEVEAVLGHEIAHIANGDMVTLTLIQGVLNTFVVFLSRVVGYVVDSALRKNDEENSGPGMGYYITSLVLDILLGFLAGMIVAWFSRQREFRADAGAAQSVSEAD